ncbi:hypothetical protein IU500_19350 [Nocardia terpenica]|uniref:hypothetical protein n=1 Tax=Nocardia terpenica TaxID=455432 RepID=UPI001892DC17|nr:hypothetical protein [Nocardia terpenica]MBF6062005.1 hypothetical protein [Nocardia terpenica]MBF6106195.1 hypothetical protein [Nocardia terpenica]MBF6110425.1 hypothetical protein [Nocardia terpenica]MBF6120738.1 hypothetical protein [Nocardia terpenica]MBF6151761.1 hypothetical protein [Nocardia terpenica]
MDYQALHHDSSAEARIVACRYDWRDLDHAETALLWDELADWVAWLRHRYQLGSRVPGCWWRHEAVVEELTALMAAHAAAYTCPAHQRELPREDMTAWHTQWLWPTLERLTRISDFSSCRPTECGYRRNRQPELDGLADIIATHTARAHRSDPDTR